MIGSPVFSPGGQVSGRTPAELGHGTAGGARHPDIVIAVNGDPPRAGDGTIRIERAVHRAVGSDHRDIAAGVFVDDVPQVGPHVCSHIVGRHGAFPGLELAFELLLEQGQLLPVPSDAR